MPLTGERKKEWSKRWRKESIANGYGKWLYRKRALNYEDASAFRQALVAIERRGDKGGGATCAELAREALAASADRWDALGPPPQTRTKKVPLIASDTLLEAIAKLELSQELSQ